MSETRRRFLMQMCGVNDAFVRDDGSAIAMSVAARPRLIRSLMVFMTAWTNLIMPRPSTLQCARAGGSWLWRRESTVRRRRQTIERTAGR